jgi:tetratricopeptide (TPR) repeat protein
MPGVETDRALIPLLKRMLKFDGEGLLKGLREAWEKTHDEEFLRFQALPAIWLKRQDEGVDALTQAINLRPGWATAYVYRAVLLATKAQTNLDLKVIAQADADLRKALELDPKHDLALRCSGYKFRMLGKLDESIKEYTQAIKLRPALFYYLERCDTWKQYKKYDAALADATEITKRWPDFATGWLMRAELNRLRGDLDAADRDLSMVATLRPNQYETLKVMAVLQAMRGKFQEAQATLQKIGGPEGKALKAYVTKLQSDSIRASGLEGWRTLLLEAKPELEAYLAVGRTRDPQLWSDCKAARAEIEALLKEE